MKYTLILAGFLAVALGVALGVTFTERMPVFCAKPEWTDLGPGTSRVVCGASGKVVFIAR
jgi:hypothetical protein